MFDREELATDLLRFDLFGSEEVVANYICNKSKEELKDLYRAVLRQVEAFKGANVNPCGQIEACIKTVFLKRYGIGKDSV